MESAELIQQSTNLPEVRLLERTPPTWWDCVESNFDEFLINHATCERKASITGMQFVYRYPEKTFLLDPMIRFAREELLHFHQVTRILLDRGLTLKGDEVDTYVNELLSKARNSKDGNFMDRLLIFTMVEKRGTERFGIVGENLKDKPLKRFYQKLATAEARHHELFVEIALHYFSRADVEARIREFEEIEASIIQKLPLQPTVH